MKTSFKKWFELQEIVLGSDGQRDNQTTQTAQATAQVAQNWLSQKANADLQAQLATGTTNHSALGNKLTTAGTDAIGTAPNTIAAKTTAPAVAGFLQKQFGLPKVIKSPTPAGVGFMRKKMRKQ
jgi:hypothetical protein